MVRALLLSLCLSMSASLTQAETLPVPATDCVVRFIGQVDAYDLEPVIEQLQTASMNCPEVTLLVESGGGFVSVGWFFLPDLEKLNLHTHVRGNAGSMAVPLFLAGDRRTMDADATLFLHNILQSFEAGEFDAASLREVAVGLDVLDNQYAAYVAERTSLSVESVLELMAGDTTITAVDAVKLGLAQELADH